MNELLQEIAGLEKELQTVGDRNEHNRISNLISEKREELIKVKEKEEREEVIEKKLAAIELPYDFNDLYENSTANDTIIEIVQQFKRQDLEEHNTEIEKLHQLYREQIRAANEREIQLQRQNEGMQASIRVAHNDYERVSGENDDLRKTISKLEFDLGDAESKRDNAAAQLEQANAEIEQLKSHIDDLLKEQAVGAREAYKVIETNQTLEQLITKANQEKQAKIKSAAELALENSTPFRGKFTLPEVPSITQQESPFRSQTSSDNSANTGDNQVLGTAQTVNQFPTTPSIESVSTPSITTEGIHGQQPDGGLSQTESESGEEPANKGWVLQEIAKLRKELLGIDENGENKESQVA